MEDEAEARDWLRKNPHPYAITSNRFETTHAAAAFVEELYTAGALSVTVKEIRQEPEGGYADTLVVQLPQDPARRGKIFAISNREARREGFAPEADTGQSELLFWWD